MRREAAIVMLMSMSITISARMPNQSNALLGSWCWWMPIAHGLLLIAEACGCGHIVGVCRSIYLNIPLLPAISHHFPPPFLNTPLWKQFMTDRQSFDIDCTVWYSLEKWLSAEMKSHLALLGIWILGRHYFLELINAFVWPRQLLPLGVGAPPIKIPTAGTPTLYLHKFLCEKGFEWIIPPTENTDTPIKHTPSTYTMTYDYFGIIFYGNPPTDSRPFNKTIRRLFLVRFHC